LTLAIRTGLSSHGRPDLSDADRSQTAAALDRLLTERDEARSEAITWQQICNRDVEAATQNAKRAEAERDTLREEVEEAQREQEHAMKLHSNAAMAHIEAEVGRRAAIRALQEMIEAGRGSQRTRPTTDTQSGRRSSPWLLAPVPCSLPGQGTRADNFSGWHGLSAVPVMEVVLERLSAMTPQERFDFVVWLQASAASNDLEGQHDTAAAIRSLIGLVGFTFSNADQGVAPEASPLPDTAAPEEQRG